MGERGQVLASFALLVPLVLLPVAAWSIEASLAGSRQARLVAVVEQAAEDAAQQIDQPRLRAGEGLAVLPRLAESAARVDVEGEPGARLRSVTVAGDTVTVRASEWLPMTLAALVGWRGVTLRAAATARIQSGYGRPSSLLPFPTRILVRA
ncbi:MAG: hypothetical protein ACREPA_06210 [Candidatus Dormibacteraceae bacterium]